MQCWTGWGEATENAAAAGQGCRNDVHPWCSDSHDPEAAVANVFRIFRILQFTRLGGLGESVLELFA